MDDVATAPAYGHGAATEPRTHARLFADLHARPAPQLRGPVTVSYVACLGQVDRPAAPAAAPAWADAEQVGEVVVERHHEFTTFTATVAGAQDELFDPRRNPFTPLDGEPLPARRAVAVQVEVIPIPETEDQVVALAQRHLAAASLLLVWVAEELVAVATDFRVTEGEPMRVLVMVSDRVGPGRVGRVVRRLLEIETYRALSTLALADAQRLGRRLDDLEPQLLRLVERMDDEAVSGAETLHDLLMVSGELERLASRHNFRFAAAHAYEAIVADRLSVLSESRFGGRQLLKEFLALRYTPAMRTVTSTEERLHRLIARTGRAGDLLRTRVEVAHSAQNAAMLVSLDRRAETQVRLQHAVEGLSIFAVTYYAVSILGYLLSPVADALGSDIDVVKAASVPIVLVVVWLGVRRIRGRDDHAGDDT